MRRVARTGPGLAWFWLLPDSWHIVGTRDGVSLADQPMGRLRSLAGHTVA